MRYRARFHFEGLPNRSKWMDYLQVGDKVEVVNNADKSFEVIDMWTHKGIPLYLTDQFGLVGADELERVD